MVEEVYENQRSLVVGDYSPSYLIPLADKCGPWSDSRAQPRSREDVGLPNDNWRVRRARTPGVGEDLTGGRRLRAVDI